jgi:hypothetical protein
VNDGLFTASEMDGVLPALLKPIGGKFDLDYYFCLADTIKGFKAAGYGKELETALEAAVETDDALKRKSINFILDYLKNPEKLEAFGKFDRAKFCNEEGKLYIVHVFDKDDTKEAHWDLTQEWAKKYLPAGAAPQVSEDGKRIVYEGKGVKIELFMGNDAAENQEFVQRALNANEGGTGMVLAFRGHSFSLEENFPPYIFGNRGTDIFFAPNSCGSASMIKSYIASNPETGMHVFGNKSTGRGQVFNYGILDGLIESAPSMKNGVRTLPTYSSMLERKKTSIEKYGGSIDTLEMPDSLSFLLMSHLYGNAN